MQLVKFAAVSMPDRSREPEQNRAWIVAADLGARVFNSHVLPRLGTTVAWRTNRIHVGARVALNTIDGSTFYLEDAVEAGVWMRLGERLDLLLAWRLGHTFIRSSTQVTDIRLHAFMVEPVAAVQPLEGDSARAMWAAGASAGITAVVMGQFSLIGARLRRRARQGR